MSWDVDCEAEDTFLYAAITNISELGIFVKTREPLDVGTRLDLRFNARVRNSDDVEPFHMSGIVQWVNPVRPLSDNRNPGMGITFVDLRAEDRERLVELVRTIAYVRDSSN